MKLSELKHNPKNPRSISSYAREWLEASMTQFGELSWIVFNTATWRLVWGHQRNEAIISMIWDADINIIKKYDEPSEDGTVWIGIVEIDWNVFNVRLVYWEDESKEYAANLTANNSAITGYFDISSIGEAIEFAGAYEWYEWLMLDNITNVFWVTEDIETDIKQEAGDWAERLREISITYTEDEYIEVVGMLESMIDIWFADNYSEIVYKLLKNDTN